MAGTAKLAAEAHKLRAMRAHGSTADPRRSAEQRADFASAAGLMQLSSAAVAADAADTGSSSSGAADAVTSPADASLPLGWQRIIHGSGLPCYVHDGLGVVCWTRPYPLDVGGENALSQPEFHRLVKQHVPPLSIFAPPSGAAARQRTMSLGAVTAVRPDAAGAASLPLPPLPPDELGGQSQSKKRKVDTAIKERAAHIQEKMATTGKQPSMTLDEFTTLSIGDPRVLQACMELSIKTPAQVLQEYQNRNRGVSINYNTVPVEGDGVKLFKTIVTAGSTVAEGIASTKKIAKQLGAQQLLAMLHERTARKYHEVADMYNSSLKGQPVIAEASTFGPAVPLHSEGGGGRPVDSRLHRGTNRLRRIRRPSPNREFHAGGSYRDYGADRRGPPQPHWSGYNQQPPQQQQQQQMGSWTGGGQQDEMAADSPGPERVVVYSSAQPGAAPGVYGGGHYYNNSNSIGGNAWGGYPNSNRPAPPPNLPSVYPQEFGGAYGDSHPPPANRPYGYGAYRSRSSDRSTSIERVTANLRNQMSNP